MKTEDNLATASAPDGAEWEFNEEVTAAFEDMLERSVPNYADMRRMVTNAALWFLDHQEGRGPRVLDIGCSRGGALEPIVKALGVRGTYTGLEISEPMVAAARAAFKGGPEVKIDRHDLRDGLPNWLPPQSVILSVLTLQFVPIDYRIELLAALYGKLQPGGGLILVEKVQGSSMTLKRLEADLYHDMKRGHGYTEEAIERKRLSLEGKLVPLTATWNEDALRGAGFRDVDCVWAWMNFRGWIAVKGDLRAAYA